MPRRVFEIDRLNCAWKIPSSRTGRRLLNEKSIAHRFYRIDAFSGKAELILKRFPGSRLPQKRPLAAARAGYKRSKLLCGKRRQFYCRSFERVRLTLQFDIENVHVCFADVLHRV
jgi:hypothetical protein